MADTNLPKRITEQRIAKIERAVEELVGSLSSSYLLVETLVSPALWDAYMALSDSDKAKFAEFVSTRNLDGAYTHSKEGNNKALYSAVCLALTGAAKD